MSSSNPIAAQRITFAEAARLDPDQTPAEIDRGELVAMTRNTWRHGEIVGNVYFVLRQYARQMPGWSVSVGDPGTKLGRDPDVLRGPDVAMTRTERRPTGSGADGWLEGAPEVVVEVAGDRQAFSQLTAKALEYLAAGGRVVWVVDPSERRVVEYTPPDHVRILGADGELDGGDVLPGFRCPIAMLFE